MFVTPRIGTSFQSLTQIPAYLLQCRTGQLHQSRYLPPQLSSLFFVAAQNHAGRLQIDLQRIYPDCSSRLPNDQHLHTNKAHG